MSSKFIAIGLVAILLIAGVGAGVYFMGGDDTQEDIQILENGVQIEVFGNANGDYRLDENDKQIIQDYIDGKVDKSKLLTATEKDGGVTRYLADANVDGVVDAKDIEYLEKLINRTADYIYFDDVRQHFSKCPMKVDRIASEFLPNAEILALFGMQDKIVAVDNAPYLMKDHYLKNRSADLPDVVNMFSNSKPDYEAVQEVDPQIWLTFVDSVAKKRADAKTSAEVFTLGLNNFSGDNIYESGCVKGVLLGGILFDKIAEAEKYVKWVVDLWTSIKEKTDGLADADRPTVLYTMYAHYITSPDSNKTLRLYTENDPVYQATKLAGGKNLIDSIPGVDKFPSSQSDSYQVGLEAIYDQKGNFDYVFCHSVRLQGNGIENKAVPPQGYLVDDNTEFIEKQSALHTIDVFDQVEKENCFITNSDYRNNAAGGMLLAAYMSIILHPELFPDWDMTEIHQEYLDMLGIDHDMSKHGVFFYQYD